MELRPEQQQAIDYAWRAGSEKPLDSIRSRIVATFAEMEAELAEVEEEAARRKPAEGIWSVQEVVDHLVESHRPAVRELESMIAGRSPDGEPIPAGIQSADPMAPPSVETQAALAKVHADLLAALDHASDDTPLSARAKIVMVVKCADDDGALRPVHWVQAFDWKAYAIFLRAHTLEHLRQVRRISSALQ